MFSLTNPDKFMNSNLGTTNNMYKNHIFWVAL